MERLTIDEIIEHCDRKTSMFEKTCDIKYLETTTMNNPIKEYWEHKQVAEYLRKLKEYEDLEEQGLLLRLPCKNWMDIVFGKQETFFGIDENYIENPIREITVDSADRFTWYDGWKTLVLNGADENGLDWEFSPEDIGKTVFLTKSEAEAKLKGLRGNND